MAAADTTLSPVHFVENIVLSDPANVPLLTDSSGGTASDTIADVPAAYTEATLANQIASLAAKVNAILTVMHSKNLLDAS